MAKGEHCPGRVGPHMGRTEEGSEVKGHIASPLFSKVARHLLQSAGPLPIETNGRQALFHFAQRRLAQTLQVREPGDKGAVGTCRSAGGRPFQENLGD